MAASGFAAEDGVKLDCFGWFQLKRKRKSMGPGFFLRHRLGFALTESGLQASRLKGCRATLEI